MKSKTKIITIAITCLLPLLIKAQNLTGKISDTKGVAIPFAGIMLLDADSTFISGTVADEEGKFIIRKDENVACLKISSVGYRHKIVPIDGDEYEMGSLLLDEDDVLLGEVIVKGSLPKTRIQGDAMVTTVAGSVLQSAGTATDVLAKTPGVTVKDQAAIVFGRGTPVIYIDGREVRDASEMTQLASDNIQSVEVVSNPGARYDKSVKAVIRIRTKKKSGDGIGAGNRTNVSYNDKWSVVEQMDLNYRRGDLDISGMAAYTGRTAWRKLDVVQQTWLDRYWEQNIHSDQIRSSRQLTGNVSVNYSSGQNHSFGASYRYRRQPVERNEAMMLTDIFRDGRLYEISQSLVTSDNLSTRHEGNVYYSGKTGKWKIDFNGTILKTKENAPSQTLENITDTAALAKINSVHSDADAQNSLYAGKVVLSHPLFGNDLSFGGEYTHTSRATAYHNLEGFVNDDESEISEDIAGLFAEYNITVGKAEIEAGFRLENVDFVYFTDRVRQEEQSKTYTDIFPSIAFSLPLGKVQTRISYASDISRPSYKMLRSRVDYVNRYTYEAGNPFLLPAVVNTLAIDISYGWWQLYADMQHRRNAFILYSETYSESDPTIALLSQKNAEAYKAVNIMLNMSPVIGRWSPMVGLEMYKQWYFVEAPGKPSGERLSLSRPSFAARWRNTVELPFSLRLSADAQWEGRTDQDNSSFKPVFWADAAIFRPFLNQSLTVLLQANDIFNTYKSVGIMYYGRLRSMSMVEKYSRRSIALTVQYRFNAAKSKYRGTGAGDLQKGRI